MTFKEGDDHQLQPAELNKAAPDYLEYAEADASKTGDEPTETVVVSAYAGLSTSETIRKFWRLYLIGFAVAFSGTYLGYTLSLPGSIIANRGFINQFGTVRDPVTGALSLKAVHVSAWNGTNFGSSVIFQLLSPFTANKFGLRFNMWSFTLLIVLAIVLEIVAKEWIVYLMAKVVAGFAAGFIGTSTMSYISEITMPNMRGSHLGSFAFFFSLGQLTSAIGLEVLERTNPLEYKRAFYSEFAILGVWLPILICLPESPVWLYKKGKFDKCKRSIRRLVGDVPGFDMDREFQVLAAEVDFSETQTAKHSRMGWLACFKGTNLRRTLISTVPLSMQNFVGAPLFFNLTTYFFSQVGVANAFTANLVVFCVLMGGVIISFYLVERVGRRPLLLIGGTIMSIANLIVGGIGTKGNVSGSSLGGLLVAMCSIWVFAYSISTAPIGWIALVELSTPALRAQTAGIGAFLQSLSGVIFNYTVPLMLSDEYAGWGAKIGFFFGPLSVLSTVLVYFVVPESKSRSYAELDELFERRIPARKFKQTVTAVQERAGREAEGITLERV